MSTREEKALKKFAKEIREPATAGESPIYNPKGNTAVKPEGLERKRKGPLNKSTGRR